MLCVCTHSAFCQLASRKPLVHLFVQIAGFILVHTASSFNRTPTTVVVSGRNTRIIKRLSAQDSIQRKPYHVQLSVSNICTPRISQIRHHPSVPLMHTQVLWPACSAPPTHKSHDGSRSNMNMHFQTKTSKVQPQFSDQNLTIFCIRPHRPWSYSEKHSNTQTRLALSQAQSYSYTRAAYLLQERRPSKTGGDGFVVALGTANEPDVLRGRGACTTNAVAHDASAGRHANDVFIPHDWQSSTPKVFSQRHSSVR